MWRALNIYCIALRTNLEYYVDVGAIRISIDKGELQGYSVGIEERTRLEKRKKLTNGKHMK